MLSSLPEPKYRFLDGPEGAPKVLKAQYAPGPGVKCEDGTRMDFSLGLGTGKDLRDARRTSRENRCGMVLVPHSPCVVESLGSKVRSSLGEAPSESLEASSWLASILLRGAQSGHLKIP
eukprot:CAMPEP_0206436884 /NCGR_PEP_ID=MMETSP0324_2-20121206/10732_1 /ASSEMBLY_ACC=CAM_ASM_000836 /TAXON_ID=2866 /ORGANISM="Crypthecodinium cohnii, Strain Seligo" /LENGTH=118 /DNA_ID=CAMNT_0053904101 /DNA_START=422 /DNA_END=778 /DNA_ORIENTATION=-